MRHYEIVFLVHPDRSEQVPAMIDRYREMVAAGSGITHRVEDWGRRWLAYMINNVHKAHYVLFNIECDLNVLADIERNFRFNDSILRHLVIRRKHAETGESPMALAKAKEDAEEAAKLAREIERRQNASDEEADDASPEEAADVAAEDVDIVAAESALHGDVTDDEAPDIDPDPGFDTVAEAEINDEAAAETAGVEPEKP